MGEVINLRQKRKEREREAKAAVAAENRVAFGQTKTEKRVGKAKKEIEERNLDGHKLSSDDGA